MLSRSFKKVRSSLNLNSPFMRIGTHVDGFEPSEDDYRLFIAKLDDLCLLCFCLLPAAIFVPLSGAQTWLLHTNPYKSE